MLEITTIHRAVPYPRPTAAEAAATPSLYVNYTFREELEAGRVFGKFIVRMVVSAGGEPAEFVTWYKPLSFANMLPTIDL